MAAATDCEYTTDTVIGSLSVQSEKCLIQKVVSDQRLLLGGSIQIRIQISRTLIISANCSIHNFLLAAQIFYSDAETVGVDKPKICFFVFYKFLKTAIVEF